ncbi:MAG: protein kinase [Myxococcales bacterium]|nr:protein kinase [Myxococcales bacterium]
MRPLPVPGDLLAGKYTVVRALGHGGMGVVYEAEHARLGQNVALKFLKPEHVEIAQDLARFEREARAAATLKSPHVVRIYDVDTTPEGVPYIVMELLAGHDLSQELRRRDDVPLAEVVDWMLQVCAAMGEAHARGIIHRDLKPSNVFLCEGGEQVKVVDFGISKLLASGEFTGSSSALGTPQYMAPEQLRGSRDVDGRIDIWAIAIMTYRILARRFPFAGETPAAIAVSIVTEEPTPLAQHRPDLPPTFCDALMRALVKLPSGRYRTVFELAEALAPFGSGKHAAPRASSPSLASLPSASVRDVDPPAASGRAVSEVTVGATELVVPGLAPKRRWGVAVLAGAAVVAVGLGALTALRTPRPPPQGAAIVIGQGAAVDPTPSSALPLAPLAPSADVPPASSTDAPLAPSVDPVASAPAARVSSTHAAPKPPPGRPTATGAAPKPTATGAGPKPTATVAPKPSATPLHL